MAGLNNLSAPRLILMLIDLSLTFVSMVYKVIGLMSGSSLDGLDIVYVHLQEKVVMAKDAPRQWAYTMLHTACYAYSPEWKERLMGAVKLSAMDYQLLHSDYGHFLGQQVLRFIGEFGLEYQVQLIASHGHTSFHLPGRKMTAQLGDGAALAAVTGINVVSDLRAMDVALGGQGAPIVPMGEKLLLGGYDLFLNLGGIANISSHSTRGGGTGGEGASVVARGGDADALGGAGQTAGADRGGGSSGARGGFVGFDICPANRVLNELAEMKGMEYDADGALAAKGTINEGLLNRLNELEHYGKEYPKSLGNEFGMGTVLPMIREAMIITERSEGYERGGARRSSSDEALEDRMPLRDAMRTYVEHVAVQVREAVERLSGRPIVGSDLDTKKSWDDGRGTGSGAVERLRGVNTTGEEGRLNPGGVQDIKKSGGSGKEAEDGSVEEVGDAGARKMLVTGGGAFNTFLIERLRALLGPLGIEVVVPEAELVNYKEALVMALLGVLRWREENTVLAPVTGASRDSIGGAVWIGQGA